TQLGKGNPNPSKVTNKSFGYGANFGTANSAATSPMQPYYWPYITGQGTHLQGYFDWRPKDINEGVVAASSTDGGLTWQFQQMAVVLTNALPVNQQSSNPDGTLADDGFGHATIVRFIGPTPIPTAAIGIPSAPTPTPAPLVRRLLYMLDRSAGASD